MYSMLAAILHVGNIEFGEQEKKHQTSCHVQNTDILDIGVYFCSGKPKRL